MWSDEEVLRTPEDRQSDEWVFRLAGVGKTYRIYERPIDRVLELFGRGHRYREFVALQPLTLDVPRGVSLGIVGDNGAGKSTLMHLLAGSHQPSSGQLSRRGKVLGLLELGVGFHPDFSGRDNVYFYGDMLGLERAFVQRKFDEITAFAEIDAFIDQPLRTYSTGMRVRLAFALVASLEPDILIVDEALAVGDMHFQKKCIDRMMDFRRAGKTIVLCSHSLYHINMFCDDVLWLQGGQLRMRGSPQDVLPAYEAYQMARGGEQRAFSGASPTSRAALARIGEFAVVSSLPMETGEDLCIRWSVAAAQDVAFHVSFSLKMDSGRGVYVTGTQLRGVSPMTGNTQGEILFPALPLMGGVYSLHMRVWDDEGLVQFDEQVIDDIMVRRDRRELGLIRLPCEWRMQWSDGNDGVMMVEALTGGGRG